MVSVDSMQVYRGMDIGTAKPSASDQARVPHHMIDLVDPQVRFSVAEFQRQGRAVLRALTDQRTTALIVGGSGLHFRALVDPLDFPPHDPSVRAGIEAMDIASARARLVAIDPSAGLVLDLDNPRRVQRALEIYELTNLTPAVRASGAKAQAVAGYEAAVPFVAVGIDPGAQLAGRVDVRLDDMLAAGLLEEVTRLAGVLGPTAAEAVGYKQLLGVVRGELSEKQGVDQARRATMSLAKRQRTYFRRDPRIEWVPWSQDPIERYELVKRSLVEET